MLADSLQCEAFMQSLTHDADSPSLDNEARSPGQTPVLVDVNDECFRHSRDEFECMAPVSHDSDGLLMYTSGTTGRPKGVVLSHSNLLAGGQNVAIGHELTAEDRALIALCEQQVGRFKCPDRIHFLVELPKGPVGKNTEAKAATGCRRGG